MNHPSIGFYWCTPKTSDVGSFWSWYVVRCSQTWPGNPPYMVIKFTWLVVEPYPSENLMEWKSVGMMTNIWKNTECSKPPTSYICDHMCMCASPQIRACCLHRVAICLHLCLHTEAQKKTHDAVFPISFFCAHHSLSWWGSHSAIFPCIFLEVSDKSWGYPKRA